MQRTTDLIGVSALVVSCILGKEKKNDPQASIRTFKNLSHWISEKTKLNNGSVFFISWYSAWPLVSINGNHYRCHHYYQERDFFRLREKTVCVLWTKGKVLWRRERKVTQGGQE